MKVDGVYYTFSFRLEGFDAPEMKPKKNDLQTLSEEDQKYYKNMAKRACDELRLLMKDKQVTIKCGDADKYGRVLAHLYTPDSAISLNQ